MVIFGGRFGNFQNLQKKVLLKATYGPYGNDLHHVEWPLFFDHGSHKSCACSQGSRWYQVDCVGRPWGCTGDDIEVFVPKSCTMTVCVWPKSYPTLFIVNIHMVYSFPPLTRHTYSPLGYR